MKQLHTFLNTMKLSELSKPKSDQLNADDLVAGPITIKIREAVQSNDPKQNLWLYYEGDGGKPYKPNLGMRRAMAFIWGDPETSQLAGRHLRLFNNPTIKIGSETTGGIQISHASHIPKALTFLLTVSKGRRVAFTVNPLATFDMELAELKKAANLTHLKAAWEPLSKDAKAFLRPELDALKLALAESTQTESGQ